jgi:hypothetical protein
LPQGRLDLLEHVSSTTKSPSKQPVSSFRLLCRCRQGTAPRNLAGPSDLNADASISLQVVGGKLVLGRIQGHGMLLTVGLQHSRIFRIPGWDP